MWNELTAEILVCAALVATCAAGERPAQSLAQTEREFAEMSMQEGMYKAFVKYAAENGIQFAPHPRKVHEALTKQAAGPMPTFSLNWRPIWTDVAISGDMGFNAGPWVATDLSPAKEPSEYGYFLSVWQKQSDGTWRFIIDAGVRVPPFPPEQLQQPWHELTHATYKPAAATDTAKQTQSLRDLDAQLLSEVNSDGMLAAHRKYFADHVLLYRQGRIPASDRKTVEHYLGEDKHGWSWSVIETGVSQAADFGYSHGSFEATPKADDQKALKGYYLHVWKRDARGRWRLAADVIMPRLTPQNAPSN